MNRKRIMIFFSITGILSGCTNYSPQNLNSHSDLNDMQFISKNNKIDDDMGRLYKQCRYKNKDGDEYLTNWSATSLILFPTGALDANRVDKGAPKKDSLTAIEKSGVNAKTDIANVFSGSLTVNSAYRYNAEVNQVSSLQTSTLKFNKLAGSYITRNPDCNFAYINALYKGTAFIEVLKQVSSNAGGGNEAAFRIDGDFYQSNSANRFITGNILFELTSIKADELEMMSSFDPGSNLIAALNAKEVMELKSIRPELKINIE